MPVTRPEIEITKERVYLHLGKVRNPAGFEPLIEEALSLANGLLEPAVAWRDFQVEDMREEDGVLFLLDEEEGEEAMLHVGQKINLLSPAKRCHLSAATIGMALEKKVSELNERNEVLRGWMLDMVGVIAIEKLREQLRRIFELRAEERGWRLGPLMQPGSLSGWSLKGQRALLNLLPTREIGLHLNEKCVMVPQKSVSGLVGMGEGYGASMAEYYCEECPRLTCPWRRNRNYESIGGRLRTGLVR